MEATVLNVNLGHNQGLMEWSRKLYEYTQFVAVVRRYRETEKDLTRMNNLTLDECIHNNILSDSTNYWYLCSTTAPGIAGSFI